MIATAHELKVRGPTFCDYLANRKITTLLDDAVEREPIQAFLSATKRFVIGERYFHKLDCFQGVPKGRIVVKTKGVEIKTQSSRDLRIVIDKLTGRSVNFVLHKS